MADEEVMLKLEDVHAYYGESHILQGISLKVGKGKIVALLGRNGVGKTTTLKTILNIVRSKNGKIWFLGEDITYKPTYEIAKDVAYIPQERGIFPKLTVKENILLSLKTYRKRLDKKSIEEKIEQIFALFPVLKERENKMGNTLSGGEQAMLTIGRALLSDGKLLLWDESFSGLSPTVISKTTKRLKEMCMEGKSILLVEQNVLAALQISDYCYVMDKGKIIFEGSGGELKQAEEIMKRLISIRP